MTCCMRRESTSASIRIPAIRRHCINIIDGGWMWVLRFDNGITSLGWTSTPASIRCPLPQSPAEEWAIMLEQYPAVARQIGSVRPAAPFSVERPLIRTERLQRQVATIAGDTWALLPHTAGFIDPFYSTGIAHSLLASSDSPDHSSGAS